MNGYEDSSRLEVKGSPENGRERRVQKRTEETVFLTVSPAMAGAMSREVSDYKPQIMPTTKYLEDELHREQDDSDEEQEDGSYQKMVPTNRMAAGPRSSPKTQTAFTP